MSDIPKLPTEGFGKLPKRPTSEDYLNIAKKVGIGQEAEAVLADKGEKANEIFSGGKLMDFFDVLNALQYGIVGMIKGKGFKEGIRTRQSFSDKDSLGQYGIPGMIGGIALDIIFDPLTWIPPTWFLTGIPKTSKLGKAAPFLTKYKGIPGARKVSEGIAETFRIAGKGTGKLAGKVVPKIPEGKIQKTAHWLTKQILGAQGADEAFHIAKMAGDAEYAIAQRNLVQMAKPFQNIDDEMATKIPQMFKEAPNGARVLKTPDEIAQVIGGESGVAAQKMAQSIEGNQAVLVAEDVISEATAHGGYFHNTYMDSLEKASKQIGVRKQGLAGSDVLKRRTLLYDTPEKLAKNIEKETAKIAKKFEPEIATRAKRLREAKSPQKIERLQKSLDDIVKKSEDEQLKKAESIQLAHEANKAEVRRIRAEKGEIKDSMLPLAITIEEQSKLVANARMYSKLADSHAITDDLIKAAKEAGESIPLEGYTKVPKRTGAINKWGKLEDKYIPTYMFEALTELNKSKTPFERFVHQGWGYWKWAHTAGSLATHVRNIFSNQILNWWKLGMTPGDPRTIDASAIALKEMAKPGDYVRAAEKLGYNTGTFASNELSHLYGSPQIKEAATGMPGKIRKFFDDKIVKPTSELYQGAENHAKLSAFIYNKKYKGMDDLAAWLAAESATFNYSQVGPLVRKMREQIFGVPFLTFGVKAAPAVARTVATKPGRISIFGKIRKAIENQANLKETERERASEPQWLRDGFYIKLPMKDKYGRSAYFDLTYIIPFGDLASGQILQRQVNRETGLPESYAESAIQKAPVINMLTEIGKNQDFYGNQIWKPTDSSDKQIVDLTRHIMKMYMPPFFSDMMPGGYITKGKDKGKRRPPLQGRLGKAQAGTQYRTGLQEFMRNLGIKIQPIDVSLQENYMEWEKKKALQTLLRERGVLNTYQRDYLSKK